MAGVRQTLQAYSLQAAPRLPPGNDAHELGQALVQQAEREPPDALTVLRKFFQTSDPTVSQTGENTQITEYIRQESSVLAKKLHDFYQTCPEDERVDLSQFVPTVEGVVDLVKQIETRWQAQRRSGLRGKAMVFFHKVCGTIDAHKSLLGILPQGNEYVSLFTGVLKVVIQASSNYEKVANGLAESLATIGEYIEDIQVDIVLFQTDPMIQRVSEFYSQVFLFLSKVMDWIMEKRRKKLLKSFSESLVDMFKWDLQQIIRRSDRITHLAAQSSRAEVQFLRQKSDRDERRRQELEDDGLTRPPAERHYGQERLRLREARIEAYRQEEAGRQQQLGFNIKLLLEENLRGEQSRQFSFEMTNARARQIEAGECEEVALSHQNSRVAELLDDVATCSACLEDYFSRDRVRPPLDTFLPLPFEPEVISRLSEWAQGSSSSSMLWLEGPVVEGSEFDNPLTLLAGRVIEIIDANHLHVISYFCNVPRLGGTGEGPAREIQGLVALLYALIRQVVELLPPRFESNMDLSEERFLRLEGTLESWDEGLQVFKDVLELVPASTVLCIIHGADVLDDRNIQKPLSLLLGQLRACSDKLRVLFTTSGRSYCLGREMKARETVVIDGYRENIATYDVVL